MTSRRRTALGLALAVVCSTVVAVSSGAAAGAAPVDAALDQGSYAFVAPGTHHVSGMLPGAGGLTVGVFLDNVNQPTTTAAADGTFAYDLAIGDLPDGQHSLVIQAPAPGGGRYQLQQTLWMTQDQSQLSVEVPGGGQPVTALGPEQCVPVVARLTDPASTWNASSSRAYLGDGRRTAAVTLGVDTDPSVLSACVPVRQIANGTTDLWVSLVSDAPPGTTGAGEHVAHVTFPLELTTSATFTTSTVGPGEQLGITGSLVDPGPDLVVTLTLDGAARPATSIWASDAAAPYTYTALDSVNVWDNPGPGVQLLADGPHTWHVSVTSRGTTTDFGDLPATVDTAAHVDIATATVSPADVHVTGTLGNIVQPGLDHDLRVVVTHEGFDPVVSYVRTDWAQRTFDAHVGTAVFDSGPTTVTVTGHDRHGVWATSSVVVSGGAATPAITPSRPSPPTAVTLGGTGSLDGRVGFGPPLTDGGSPVSGYTVEIQGMPYGSAVGPVSTFTAPAGATSVTLPGISTYYDWQVSVRAANAVGDSVPVVATLSGSDVQGTPPRTSVPLGSPLTLGTLWTSRGGGTPSTSAQVQFRTTPSAAWTTVATATLTSGVVKQLVVTPKATGQWRVAASGGTGFVGSVGPVFPVTVLGPPAVSMVLSASSVRLGATVTFSGAVSPSYAGRRAYLQRYSAGAWRTVTSTVIGSTSRWSLRLRTASRTDYRWRALVPATTTRPAGLSRALLLTVR